MVGFFRGDERDIVKYIEEEIDQSGLKLALSRDNSRCARFTVAHAVERDVALTVNAQSCDYN